MHAAAWTGALVDAAFTDVTLKPLNPLASPSSIVAFKCLIQRKYRDINGINEVIVMIEYVADCVQSRAVKQGISRQGGKHANSLAKYERVLGS